MYYLHNLNSSSYPRGWLWLYLLLWNYSWYLSHYYVHGFSLHHFGMSPRCLVEKVKAITGYCIRFWVSLMSSFGVLHVLVTVSTTVTNTMTKGILGREGFVPQLLVQPPFLLPPRTTCPGGPTHSGLLPSVSNQECALQTYMHSDIDSFSVEPSLSDNLGLCQVDKSPPDTALILCTWVWQGLH